MHNSSYDLYCKEIKNNESLDLEKEANLIEKAKKGNKKAEKQLVESNLKFVISVARRYRFQGLPLEDLVAEGNIGLLKAVKKFDPKRNFKFISYAVWWIRQRILQALAEHSRVVKIPLYTLEILYKSKEVRCKLEQQHGRLYYDDEIIQHVAQNEIIKRSPEILKDLLCSSTPPLYLNDYVDEDQSVEFIDMLADKTEEEPRELPPGFFDCLEENEVKIIRMYYGFEEHCYTLDEISAYLQLSRERIRQLLEKARVSLKKRIRFVEAKRAAIGFYD